MMRLPQPPQRQRELRHRPSQLLDTYTDEEIRERYCFNRDSIAFICVLVRDDLERPTKRNHALSVETPKMPFFQICASKKAQNPKKSKI